MAILIEYMATDETEVKKLLKNETFSSFQEKFNSKVNERIELIFSEQKLIDFEEVISVCGINFLAYKSIISHGIYNHIVAYPKIVDIDILTRYGEGSKEFLMQFMEYEWDTEDEAHYKFYVVKSNSLEMLKNDFSNQIIKDKNKDTVLWKGLSFEKELYSYISKTKGFTPVFPTTWEL